MLLMPSVSQFLLIYIVFHLLALFSFATLAEGAGRRVTGCGLLQISTTTNFYYYSMSDFYNSVHMCQRMKWQHPEVI